MNRTKTKLRCPFCDGETVKEYTDETCATCGTTMVEWKLCECCGEYTIPYNECADFCQKCKSTVQKKLYAFLKGFTEKEIDVLDNTVDGSFYWFIKEYEEKENGI